MLQADLAKAEAHAAELQQQLTDSEGRISSKAAELDSVQKQLEGVQQELSKAAAVVTERDSKVRMGSSNGQRAHAGQDADRSAAAARHTTASSRSYANSTSLMHLDVRVDACWCACRLLRWRLSCARASHTHRRCRTTTPACRLMCRCADSS